jgi:ADP-ribosylarginine hydrolase
MSGRAPGMTCIRSAKLLRNDGSNWRDLPFSSAGGGCGASMRAACIGLYFYNNMDKLIEVSIETGRTTHHNPLGYLGSFVAALFTAFSIQNIPSNEWLYLLLK